jgi:predicted nucleic acid-binding protein
MGPGPDIGRRRLVYDAGVLVAWDRGDRRQWARLEEAKRRGLLPIVPAPVVTQVWRSPRQANLARLLDQVTVEAVDDDLARAAGVLCAKTGTRDVVDAIVVATAARRHGIVVTSDGDDISRLARHVRGVVVNTM